MPAPFRNYYQTLGVPKSASADEIKSAFRKLARQYHPDVAKDKKAAEEKFKEINEAYEVLSNPDHRKKYDTYGESWSQAGTGTNGSYGRSTMPEGFGDIGGFSQAGGEFHFGGTGFSDFFEQFFGMRHGRGYHGGTAFEESPERGKDVEADLLITLEEVLHGATRSISLRRPGATQPQTYTIKIPQGVHEGQRIRLAGQGESGHGISGDLYLRVKLQQHPDFYFEGSDIFHDVEIPAWQAALGGELTIPTPEGRVKLKIPSGTQSGKKFRIPGQGLPINKTDRGDFFALITIQIPTKLTAKEKAAWEKLKELENQAAR